MDFGRYISDMIFYISHRLGGEQNILYKGVKISP